MSAVSRRNDQNETVGSGLGHGGGECVTPTVPGTGSICVRPALGLLLVVALFLTAFWATRVYYWSTHTEKLFSDMADFEFAARGVLSSFTFNFNGFFKSYLSPSIPLLRAAQVYLFGDTIEGWRVFQSTLLCIGVLWTSFELLKATGSRLLVVALLAIFLVSKPSIFWSFKLAREGIGESALMLTIAACLNAMRTRRALNNFLAGVIFCLAMLIRGTFIFALPFVLLLFAVPDRRRGASASKKSSALLGADSSEEGVDPSATPWGTSIRCTLLFALGLGIAWSPWIVRTYRLYGAPVYLSTMGPYVFFWDLGKSKVTLEDGSVIEVSAQSLQDEASSKFKNDYEASLYAQHLMMLYMKQNAESMPSIFFNRLRNTVVDPDVHLTHVSRHDLYPETSLDEAILIDKAPWAIITGILGLCLLPIVFVRKELLLLSLLSVIPWINAAIMIGYARMLESFISLFLFGCVAAIVGVVRVGGLALRFMGARNFLRG